MENTRRKERVQSEVLILGIDLHYDLLSYLAAWPQHTAYDPGSVVNLSQAIDGGIETLVLPIYSATKSGSENALEYQMNIFKTLSSKITLILAIENASCFIGEHEPFEKGFKRLQNACEGGKKFLYLSLTWNGENRFGGGVGSEKGLTSEGERLLDVIPPFVTAIDLSHASDQLARDILKYLDQTKNPLKVMASHANFRAVQNVPRNLPDDIAEEIVRRKGVIGLNVIRSFVGAKYSAFFEHVAYALSKGWGESIALGADFFDLDFEHMSPESIPKEVRGIPVQEMRKKFLEEHFFSECENASFLKNLFLDVSNRFGSKVGEAFWWKNVKDKLL